jgi:hypothetical protein
VRSLSRKRLDINIVRSVLQKYAAPNKSFHPTRASVPLINLLPALWLARHRGAGG